MWERPEVEKKRIEATQAYEAELRATVAFVDLVETILIRRRREFEAQLRELSEAEALTRLCKHPKEIVVYHPDASGNNDSWFACNLCQREV